MNKQKLKLGDKVRIRKDLIPGEVYGRVILLPGPMSKTKGYEGVITHLNYEDNLCQVSGQFFTYSLEMIELVKSKKPEIIIIYRNDQKVIALDKSTGKKAIAKCSPKDDFNFLTGAKLAFDRLITSFESIEIGDKVKIIDGGAIYNTYYAWFDNFASEFASRYVFGTNPPMEGVYRVVAIHDHAWRSDTLCAIMSFNGAVYLIGKNGLKKC